jgi:POT family proton-dependent oligopeptide transporter
VAAIERAIEGGARPSVLWQAGPYLLLTLGEVFVSVTGLEFAYAQAPRAMKGTIMSFWMLTTTVGNLGVVLVSKLNVFPGAGSFLFYAALVAAAGGALALLARGFVERDYFRDEARAG